MVSHRHLLYMGLFDDPLTQIEVKNWLIDRGVVPCLAHNAVTLNYWTPDTQVHSYMGAPFIVMENGVLMPYGEAIYHLYRDHYLPVIKTDPEHAAVPGLYWPKWPRDLAEDFDGYLKAIEKGYARSFPQRHPELEEIVAPRTLTEIASTFKTKYRPHFYGAPSKRVTWGVAHGDPVLVSALLKTSVDMYVKHAYQVAARAENKMKDFGVEVMQRTWLEKAEVPNMFLTVGMDCETKEMVGIMVNYINYQARTVDCDLIAVNHDPKYRGDSLVTCAILTAARHMYELGEGWECNYGMTPIDIGLYKGAFSELEPVLGISIDRGVNS